MKRFRVLSVAVCQMVFLMPLVSSAAPQDNWYFVERWGANGTGVGQFRNPFGIALGTNGHLLVTDYSNGRIQVWTLAGVHVTNWSGLNTPVSLAVSTNGKVFVAEQWNDRIQVLDHQGSHITSWGGSGSGDGQLSIPCSVMVGTNGNVVVTETGNHRVQVFDQNGTFIRKWGSQGSFEGQFNGSVWGDVGTDGLVYVLNDAGTPRMQIFDEEGNLIRKWLKPANWNWSGPITVTEDHIFFYNLGVGTLDGQQFFRVTSADRFFGTDVTVVGVLATPDGALYACSCNDSSEGILVFKRTYRTMGPPAANTPPRPVVIRAEQRPGTVWMDIDYRVVDTDDSNVAVAALAYMDGVTGFASVVKMGTFEEYTHTNVGPSVVANQEKRLTWNVAADLSTNYVNLQVEILAKDDRGLVDLDYITIPSNGPNPDLTISCVPLNDADLVYPWYWLIATNDVAINLVSGKVYGVQGVYSNKVLAQGVSTTTNGVDFLFERLRVRLATSSEVNRAKMASSPGVTNQWTPRNGVGGRPAAINEYGFDTGDTGYWVVPLP